MPAETRAEESISMEIHYPDVLVLVLLLSVSPLPSLLSVRMLV